MSTSPGSRPRPLAVSVTFDAHSFTVHLSDGRALSVPYVYSARLAEATPQQRADYRLIGRGDGIHRPQVDEDLSVAGLLRG
ncbi:MAG: DUF2442 domain-containing protein [Bryobacteraceae bacterium]